MNAAVRAMERKGEGEEIGYVGVAKRYGVDEATLRRRHQGKCTMRAEAAQMRQKLNPKQEKELCKYINTLTESVLPPTRIMVASFASQICKKEVEMNWVSRFLKHHQDKLLLKWTTEMDCVQHKADTEGSYSDYFTLLNHKFDKYKVLPKNMYNMNEKGFMLGILKGSLCIFSKASWKAEKVKEALQDGSHE
jgi:hypothetical protein